MSFEHLANNRDDKVENTFTKKIFEKHKPPTMLQEPG